MPIPSFVPQQYAIAKELISTNEGFSPTPYEDPGKKGQYNIGYGMMLDRVSPEYRNNMTKEQADRELGRFIKESEASVRNFLGDTYDSLSPQAKANLIDMDFNMGTISKFENMRDALISGDYQRAAYEIMDSDRAIQLPERSARNAQGILGQPFTVLELQNILKSQGFDPGPIDGKFGPKTRAALQKALKQ